MGRVVIVIEDACDEEMVKLHAEFDPPIDPEEVPSSMAQVTGLAIVKMFVEAKSIEDSAEEKLDFEPPRDWTPDSD